MLELLNGRWMERLGAGERLGVIWLALGNASIAEIAAHAGSDALVLDLQHGMWERRSLEAAVGVAAGRLPVIARTADGSDTSISTALDAGCDGVLVPMVNTREQAERAVAAAHFPPKGNRSGGGLRPLAFGFDRYLERAGRVVVGVMIETIEAVENATAIASVPGLDFILLGTGDLGLSYGAIGERRDAVEEACGRVKSACAAAGLPCGIFTLDVDQARQRRDEGYQLVVLASDVEVVCNGFKDAAQGFFVAAR